MIPIVHLLLAVVVILFLLNYRRLLDGLKDYCHQIRLAASIAGPPALPIVGNGHQLGHNPFEFTQQILRFADEFRSKGEHILRLWIGTHLHVIPLDGEAAKPLVDSTVELVKSVEYDFLVPWLGIGLLISTGAKWKARRKLLTPTFHFQSLDFFVETFATESEILVEQMAPYANSGREFDFLPLIKRCTLDIICSTAMGTKLNAQVDHNSEYVRAVESVGRLWFEYYMQPVNWIPFVWRLSGNAARSEHALRTLKDFTKQVIADRWKTFKKEGNLAAEGKPRKLAFLDMLMNMKEESKLTDEDIQEEVDTFMFRGHDTTSSGIGWTVWCLATHPEVQEQARDEVDTVLGSGEVTFTLNSLKSLKYLERCISEAMRLRPPVPVVARILQNDLEMGGKMVPRGTNCFLAPIVLHRNPQEFPNIDSFDPDNFLPEKIAQRHPYSYIPFSAGPRNCIGQRFAMLEELAVVASIIRAYKVSTSRRFDENRFGTEVILRPELGFPIRIERR